MDADRRSVRLSLATGVALLLAASPAAAQDPAPPPPAPAPPPPPAVAALTVSAETGLRAERRTLALRRGRVTVTGRLTPFVAGQTVLVRVRQGGRTVASQVVPVAQAPDGAGVYGARVRLPRPGTAAIQALHPPTPQLAAVRAPSARVLVVRPSASYGTRGALVRVLQRRLRALHYAVGVTGVYDDRTARAVLAWRKVN